MFQTLCLSAQPKGKCIASYAPTGGGGGGGGGSANNNKVNKSKPSRFIGNFCISLKRKVD